MCVCVTKHKLAVITLVTGVYFYYKCKKRNVYIILFAILSSKTNKSNRTNISNGCHKVRIKKENNRHGKVQMLGALTTRIECDGIEPCLWYK